MNTDYIVDIMKMLNDTFILGLKFKREILNDYIGQIKLDLRMPIYYITWAFRCYSLIIQKKILL